MATISIGADTFEQTVREHDIVLVDFWAAWCGPCRMFAPVFEKASQTHDDIVFAKVDTEAEPALAAQAGISSIPTLMAFREGILVYRQPGAFAGGFARAADRRGPRPRHGRRARQARRHTVGAFLMDDLARTSTMAYGTSVALDRPYSDVAATMQAKLGLEVAPQVILGACNPQVMVGVTGNAALEDVAKEAATKLAAALSTLVN